MTDQPASLAAALVQLQGRLPHVTKDAENPHYRSRYVSLDAITDALLPLMAGFGLCWDCKPTMLDGEFVLHYELTHAPSDQVKEGFYPLPKSGSPQQQGSAITYARRYALQAVTGLVADDDDDANAAEQADPKPRTDAARNDAGLMTRAQQREHKALRTHEPSRPAERGAVPPDDDPWAGPPPGPETAPGSISNAQLQKLGILYGKLGITDRDARLTDIRDRLGHDITTSKDLSYLEAQMAISELEQVVKGLDKAEK